jgi:DNA primase
MTSNFIPKSFVESLLSNINLIDIIGERIEIKRAGKDYKGLCPFHDEKTPSFVISETKGFYHCFGCGAHGTAVGFVMDYDNLDYVSAIRSLAEHAGVDIPTEDNESYRKEKAIVNLLDVVAKIYQAELEQSESTKKYLKNRGLNLDSLDAFTIGYAPNEWQYLVNHKNLKTFKPSMLVEAGLVTKSDKDNKYYDRFRNRVIFPIRSKTGSVIGFGGRALDEDKAKYLNSPETITFSKGNHLYGSHETRARGSKENAIYVTEGYMDVITLFQHDIKPTVATLGTAPTPAHIKQLILISEKVIFCFDGDPAGKKAALRACEIALPFAGGLTQFYFLMLPKDEDPDSIVNKQGGEEFLALSKKALPLSTLILDEIESRASLNTSEGKSKFVELTKNYYKKIKNPIFKEALIESINKKINIPIDVLSASLNSASNNLSVMNPKKQAKRELSIPKENYFIREAIGALVHFPELAQKNISPNLLAQSDISGMLLLNKIVKYIRSRDKTSSAQIIEYLRDDHEGKFLSKIAQNYHYDDYEIAEKTYDDILFNISEKIKRELIASELRGRF